MSWKSPRKDECVGNFSANSECLCAEHRWEIMPCEETELKYENQFFREPGQDSTCSEKCMLYVQKALVNSTIQVWNE